MIDKTRIIFLFVPLDFEIDLARKKSQIITPMNNSKKGPLDL